MKLAPQSRDILRQYKALMNARRHDAGRAAFTVPAKDCRHSAGQRRFAPARSVVAAGACSFPLVPVSPF